MTAPGRGARLTPARSLETSTRSLETILFSLHKDETRSRSPDSASFVNRQQESLDDDLCWHFTVLWSATYGSLLEH